MLHSAFDVVVERVWEANYVAHTPHVWPNIAGALTGTEGAVTQEAVGDVDVVANEVQIKYQLLLK